MLPADRNFLIKIYYIFFKHTYILITVQKIFIKFKNCSKVNLIKTYIHFTNNYNTEYIDYHIKIIFR